MSVQLLADEIGTQLLRYATRKEAQQDCSTGESRHHMPLLSTDSAGDSASRDQDGAASDPSLQSTSAAAIIRIRLPKEEGVPFGFRVAWCLPPRVEAVHEGSVAALAGMLPGDRLLSVSGTNFSDLSEDESIQLLRDVKKSADLEIWRDSRKPTPPPQEALSDGAAVRARRHLDYSALLNALVTADQALIGRLLTGPPSGSQQPPQHRQRQDIADQHGKDPYQHRGDQHQHGTDQERAPSVPPCTVELDSPGPCRSDGMSASRANLLESELNPSCPPPPDFNSIGPEQQKDIVQNIERIIMHVDNVAEEVMRSMVSEDNGFSALRIFYRNLDTSCALFREYFSALERALDNAPWNSIRDELSEFLQLPAQYLRKRLKILRRLRGLSSSTEAPILQTLITELANVLEPAEPVTESLTAEEAMLVSQPQLTYMKGIQPVSLAERSWIHADEVLMRRGRQWRPCYLVLLSDLLLITQRNRQVVFVTEQPLLLSSVLQHTFNVKKKDTEFHLTVPPAGSGHRKPRSLVFRAPSLEAKLSWEDQVHKQMSLMRASQSSGSLASQRSISCDAIIETYKFEDLKTGVPGAEDADDRCRRRSSSPPTSDRRLSTSSESHPHPAPLKRPRPDTLRARLFGAPGRPRPLNLKKVSASAKCCQYLSSLTVPAVERGRVTPVFERESDMTIADFVKKRQKVLFDVQSADSADGAFETFLLDDDVSSENITPPPPGSRHVSYGCVNVVWYRGVPPPPPRRCRPQYNPYLDDQIEEDYPELVGAPIRRPPATQESPEITGVPEVSRTSKEGGETMSKRGLLPSPSMKFADDDDLSPTGFGGLPLLRSPVESTCRATDCQATAYELSSDRQTSDHQKIPDVVMEDSERIQNRQISKQERHEQISSLRGLMEKPQGAKEEATNTGPQLTLSKEESSPEKTGDPRESLQNEGGESAPGESNSSSESPVLELSLPISNEGMGEPLCYEICAASDSDASSKATALAVITRSQPPEPPGAGESPVTLPSEIAPPDASCHSPPSVRAGTCSAAADGGSQDSPLDQEVSTEQHAVQCTTAGRASDSPGTSSQCSGFVDSNSPDAAERLAATDFTTMQALVPTSFFPSFTAGGDQGKLVPHEGAEEDRWAAETTALELTTLRDDVTELEDSAYLSRSDELLERHSQKVLSAALSSSLSSLARRAGSIPSSLDRSEVRADSADPPLACRSEEILPAFRCEDGDDRGDSADAGTLLTRHGTSCDLVSDVRHGFVPCARRGEARAYHRPYGQLVARKVAAFERQADEAAPPSPTSRTIVLGALWQTVPPVREPTELSPATPSSRGSFLTSGSPATTASASDLDSAGEDATLAPSSGDSQNSLFGGLPELEDEVAPDLTLELTDGYRANVDTLLMPLSDIEEITEEMDGFVSGSDILSPISEEALSASCPLHEPSPQREMFLKPIPRKRQTQIKCNSNHQQDHQASEHMRNKVRMWANGIDVIPYAGSKTVRQQTAENCQGDLDGVTRGTQPSVEQALEVIADSFRGIGSEDQADEEEVDDAELRQVEEDESRKEDRQTDLDYDEAASMPLAEQDTIRANEAENAVEPEDTAEYEENRLPSPPIRGRNTSDALQLGASSEGHDNCKTAEQRPTDNGQQPKIGQQSNTVKVESDDFNDDSHLRGKNDDKDEVANESHAGGAEVRRPTRGPDQHTEGRGEEIHIMTMKSSEEAGQSGEDTYETDQAAQHSGEASLEIDQTFHQPTNQADKRTAENVRRPPEVAEQLSAPEAASAEKTDVQTAEADVTQRETEDGVPGEVAADEPTTRPACHLAEEAERSAARPPDAASSLPGSDSDRYTTFSRGEETDTALERSNEASEATCHSREADAAPNKAEEASETFNQSAEVATASRRSERAEAASSQSEEADTALQTGAEAGCAASPRLAASLRSLLRHLSPVTERRKHDTAGQDGHDGREGRDASPRVKRFPKFWSHHSRRDKRSEAVVSLETATRGGYPPRSGKLNILTRQRPFALTTVSRRPAAAPEGPAAGRVPVPQSAAL